VFGIEAARWNAAQSGVSATAAALKRRLAQLTTLESEFLSTFAKAGVVGTSGPLLGTDY
jgi:hypothetical protein